MPAMVGRAASAGCPASRDRPSRHRGRSPDRRAERLDARGKIFGAAGEQLPKLIVRGDSVEDPLDFGGHSVAEEAPTADIGWNPVRRLLEEGEDNEGSR